MTLRSFDGAEPEIHEDAFVHPAAEVIGDVTLEADAPVPGVWDPELLERLAGGPAEVWTEDGSAGREGLVLEGIDLADDPLLLGCGPDPMLGALADLAADRGAELQVSVEEHMGCGVGTCQGCVVRSADGRWVKSCVEGPVFEADELDWSVPHA